MSNPDQPDPTDLATRIAAGDTHAFERLFTLYAVPLRRYLYRFLHSTADAEDLVHDIFLRLWERRTELGSVRDLSTYLYSAARNRALTRLRHEQHERRVRPEELPGRASAQDTTSSSASNEIIAAVQAAVDTLPLRQREVIRLRWSGYSYDEIGARLGISPKTVSVHLERATQRLREIVPRFVGSM